MYREGELRVDFHVSEVLAKAISFADIGEALDGISQYVFGQILPCRAGGSTCLVVAHANQNAVVIAFIWFWMFHEWIY